MAISVTDFTLAAPSGLTVKTATLAALDTSGAVTAGVITESATPPLAGDGSWLAWNGADGARPAGLQSKTLTAGAHTLYGHVKDGSGNRGSSAGQGVTITVTYTNQYAQGRPNGNDVSNIILWVRQSGSGATLRGYYVVATFDSEGGGWVASIERTTNNVPVTIKVLDVTNINDTKYLRLEAVNSVLTVKYGASATGPWTTIDSVTDSTYSDGTTLATGPGLTAGTGSTGSL